MCKFGQWRSAAFSKTNADEKRLVPLTISGAVITKLAENRCAFCMACARANKQVGKHGEWRSGRHSRLPAQWRRRRRREGCGDGNIITIIIVRLMIFAQSACIQHLSFSLSACICCGGGCWLYSRGREQSDIAKAGAPWHCCHCIQDSFIA